MMKNAKKIFFPISLIFNSQFIQALHLEPCNDNDEKISIINIEPPKYPTSPYNNIVEGFVELQVYVKSDGTVEKAMVVNANPKRKFNNSALKAIKKSQFSNSKENSIRCGVFTFQFNLE